jgi:hypothetical protein
MVFIKKIKLRKLFFFFCEGEVREPAFGKTLLGKISLWKHMLEKTNHFQGRHDIQHNYTQHNDTQNNDTQHNNTQHNDTQQNDTQQNDTQQNDTQQNDSHITTLSIMDLFAKLSMTLGIYDIQHNDTLY